MNKFVSLVEPVIETRLKWPLTSHVLYINNKGSDTNAVNISDNGCLIIQLFPAVEKGTKINLITE